MNYKEKADKIVKMLTDAEKELRGLKDYAKEHEMITQGIDNWLTLLVAWAGADEALDAMQRFKEEIR